MSHPYRESSTPTKAARQPPRIVLGGGESDRHRVVVDPSGSVNVESRARDGMGTPIWYPQLSLYRDDREDRDAWHPASNALGKDASREEVRWALEAVANLLLRSVEAP